MSRLELLVVCASIDDRARPFLERLARRYLLEIAAPGATARAETATELEVRRFATATPPQEHAGRFGEALAGARARGPWTPDLFEFLHHEHARYRAIAFFSYASPLTAFGLPLVPERAILLPLVDGADDLGIAPYRALFHLPRAIGYRDDAERRRVHAAVRNEQVPYELLSLDDASGPGDEAFDRLVAIAVHG